MTLAEKERQLKQYLLLHSQYKILFYTDFDFSILKKIYTTYKRTAEGNVPANEVVIMADTETSKDPAHLGETYANHVVAWTISIRAAGVNIVTLYGTRPREHIEAIEKIHQAMRGRITYIFYHNLAYDWVFLRAFYFERFGYPEKQLNTKPHYPISIEFSNGIILRDSLVLAQRSLERWANDLNVYHKKVVNEWDYNKVRNQGGSFSPEELEYIEHDTLAGVECIDAFRMTLGKTVATLPYTATGIVREHFRKVAKRRENRGRQWFLRQALDYEFVRFSEDVYHGGYSHANRYLKNTNIDEIFTDGQQVQCYDITSSYPFALISEKYPAECFRPVMDCKPEKILKESSNYAYMFVFCAFDIKLKDPFFPMPYLQYSKTYRTINELTDNGRIVQADYVEIPICDVDLKILAQYYTWNEKYTVCENVICACKEYLPRWFTDFIFKLFEEKTQLKGGDAVLYALAKSKLNSCYGMCCQHVMQNDILEDYETGDYQTTLQQSEADYQKYLDNKNTFLPYQIGIYCTAYACKNLFEIGECLKDMRNWLYSDTDSVFGYAWNKRKLNDYNTKRIKLMKQRGYQGVEHNGRLYHLGIVELDKECREFKTIHSKCYCYRDDRTGELKITVAGVPKKGAVCLDNNIDNFKVGFVFPGTVTGKLTHTYIFDKIHIDRNGNEIADSIDLSPCDYLINDVNSISWKELITDDIIIGRDYEDT